ncbi:MAG: hypothetical protein SFW66_02995 [Gammaproteobacteria bacterium]|nr:hypothetical protein [Gammaproteobacteria bacterium]
MKELDKMHQLKDALSATQNKMLSVIKNDDLPKEERIEQVKQLIQQCKDIVAEDTLIKQKLFTLLALGVLKEKIDIRELDQNLFWQNQNCFFEAINHDQVEIVSMLHAEGYGRLYTPLFIKSDPMRQCLNELGYKCIAPLNLSPPKIDFDFSKLSFINTLSQKNVIEESSEQKVEVGKTFT